LRVLYRCNLYRLSNGRHPLASPLPRPDPQKISGCGAGPPPLAM